MSTRPLHRRTAWLLLAAMLVATLASWAPSSMRSALPGGLAGLHDVCFTDPSRAPSGDEAPASSASGHCALCVLHGAAAPPTASSACGLAIPSASRAAPPRADLPPRSADRWPDAPPRAPPIPA
ncbi:MAG: DUF2946 family protein [Burkholderiales bacterium]